MNLITNFINYIPFWPKQKARQKPETPFNNFFNLPKELQIEILKKLSTKEVLNFSEISKRAFSLVKQDTTLWEYLFNRDFPNQRMKSKDHMIEYKYRKQEQYESVRLWKETIGVGF